MESKPYPTLEEFLAASHEEVAHVAPQTLVFAAGGTRRSAVLAGVSLQSRDYFRWSRERMIACFDMIFRHGVSHIITFAIVESQLKEVTGMYRERLIESVDWGLSGPEALADYARLGWRVRLLGTESLPPLQEPANRLIKMTPQHSPHTVWWFVVPTLESPWEWILKAALKNQARTRQEAIRAVYGEAIPLITLFLSFGKPLITPALLPPLLVGQVQCYWTQQPGYSLTEQEFRHILYDYAYLRATWKADKRDRTEGVLAYRAAWEQGSTIGLGMRLGPFWYPLPREAPLSLDTDEDK